MCNLVARCLEGRAARETAILLERLRHALERDRGSLRSEMFYKVYSRLPPEFPLTPLDVRQALDSIFERSAVVRGWVEVSPQETLLIIALSWGYGKDKRLCQGLFVTPTYFRPPRR